ncbi:phosphate ABC transporter permease subunit PstC [Clostridium sp. SYSU_GA19001]|uniref:phosphate ABC transporter permease subunit PstC n=1 Tax=Clostridium caldaquaticum TaxID=2940653 RepID=UPI002077846C|nr:phosphate ABC transporter permease subunit PstC [Clostridium caldaquaticum]MCM8711557.1 phosphate ABC transporter permease subunit PstC [Clostridium caldaquaticum]
MFSSKRRPINIKELIIEKSLQVFAGISILTTIAIVFSLLSESITFFKEVSINEFFTSTVWTPLMEPRNFGIIPLLVGTLMIALGASIVSIPIGLGTAIYLSEFASRKLRNIIKPILEILAGIPSIVYGFFALTFITPLIKSIFPSTEVFNVASASIAIGIMNIPLVASLSEDAMTAVPNSIRNGAYALGSTKLEVATKIVVPGAISGIIASFVLAVSRAIGETMIVAIAAGSNPQLNFNPLKSVQTMTTYIVNISMGDVAHGTVEYRTLFAVGATLFVMTFILNIIAKSIISRKSEVA